MECNSCKNKEICHMYFRINREEGLKALLENSEVKNKYKLDFNGQV